MIATLPTPLRNVGRSLRQVIRRTAPELTEGVKWGNPVWVGRSNAVCLMLYADHINLGFFRGAELSIRHPILEGTGLGMRHVRVRDLKAAKDPAIARLIRDAVALDATQP
jgi:hypothetical protein